ncbi:TetR/AcrR family transcriptional regulator [Cellulomonas sp. S1-8]|uniref:TetR/AcrR family transcriptional regulator n=1 Tax=Cellulomonas sp. S1-8 TaxID=2904790 RepID=UPI002244623C|nr:TetR/AcrR family transcriptional regulator [Cellulomonas sp. S1-8]UZN02120.1 TetR/AcrR family transcriptional regulator [Cellulomonas sp. S1-8]
MADATPRPTPRERARTELMHDLLAAARARLVQDGPHGLSLRAVARDLGLASSAVYRYVESRDALLTLLVAQSYDAAGQAVEQAAAASVAAGHDPARTWLEVARAFRAWALADPHAFELIYGTPVPGYVAPRDTVEPATRLWGVMVDVLVAAQRTGSLHPTGPPFAAEGVVTDDVLAFAVAHDPAAAVLDPAGAARCLTMFAILVGALTAELFGHLKGIADDRARAFDVVVATAAVGVGLHVDLAEAWGERGDAR